MPVMTPGAAVQSPAWRSSTATGAIWLSLDRYSVDSVAVARAVAPTPPAGRAKVPVRATVSAWVSRSAMAPTKGATTYRCDPDGDTARAPSGFVANSAGRSTQVA